MSFFDDVYNKLFKPKSDGPAELIHEVLERNERETEQLLLWKSTDRKSELMTEVYNAYHLKKKGIATALEVHLLETRYSNGFAVSYNQEMENEEFRNLFDHLKDQTLLFEYRLAQNDRRIIDRDSYEEVIEKWYLKPNSPEQNEKISNQLYGNILIEYVMIDRKPSYIKLMANIYQDRLYSEALPFGDFIEKLFEKNL